MVEEFDNFFGNSDEHLKYHIGRALGRQNRKCWQNNYYSSCILVYLNKAGLNAKFEGYY